MGLLRRLLTQRRLDADLDRELQFHIDEETRRLVGECSPAEARRRALASFGGFQPMREATRDVRGGRWLEDIGKDVTFALRMMRRTPGFALTAIVSIALGIGANAAMFSVSYALLRRPLPIEHPDALSFLSTTSTDDDHLFSGTELQQFQRAVPGAAFIAMTPLSRLQATIEGHERLVMAQLVTGNWFQTLGVGAAAGRVLMPGDVPASGGDAVVISHTFWDRTYGRNPAVVGSPLIVNGQRLTIAGVASEAFSGLSVGDQVDVWLPVSLQQQIRYRWNADVSAGDLTQPWFPQAGVRWLSLAVRIESAADQARVLAAMRAAIERQAADEHDPSARADILRVQPRLEPGATGQSPLRDRFAASLFVLSVTVALVLLIACANLASLLLARSTARGREFALRASIGARRGRLIRQMLTESLLLALTGGALGILVAWWGAHALLRLASSSATPIPLSIDLDWRLLTFAFLVSVATGLLFGLGPAVRCSRADVSDALRPGARVFGSQGASRWSPSRLLVAGQVALSLALLISAMLFVRTLDSLLMSNLGFDRDAVVSARFDATLANVPPSEWPDLRQRLLDATSKLPGVTSASLALNGPLSGGVRTSDIQIEGQPPLPAREAGVRIDYVTPGYFTTVGTTRLAGRDFTAGDIDGRARVAIVSEKLAKHFLGNQNPIGRRFGSDPKAMIEIVGVVQDAQMDGTTGGTPILVYYPLAQYPAESVRHLYVRATNAAAAAALPAAIRGAIQQAEPRLAVSDAATLEDLSRRGLTSNRIVSQLTTVFGVVAVGVACLGLYGTLSYAVSRRTKEMGLRLALGSAPTSVCWIVLRDALGLVVVGCVAGLGMAWLGLTSVAPLLHGLSPRDPWTFTTATSMFLVVAGCAVAVPAIRASRVDPLTALRAE